MFEMSAKHYIKLFSSTSIKLMLIYVLIYFYLKNKNKIDHLALEKCKIHNTLSLMAIHTRADSRSRSINSRGFDCSN